MSKKRGKDIADSTVYALAAVLGIILLVDIVLIASPQPPLLRVTGLQTSSATGTVGLFILGVCTGPLVQGWNLISLCNDVADSSISSIFSGVNIRYVMRWNETSQEFAIYSPSASSNPFTTLEINRSYMVFLNDATGSIFPSAGNNPDLNLTLVQGWNAPGFPYEFNSNFTIYFNASQHRFLMKWNTTDQEFVIWSPRMAAPPSSLMFVGDGQFIYSDATSTLRYNRTNLTT